MAPMRRFSADHRRIAVLLAAASIGWCLVVALLMTQFPMMRGGRAPSLLEALLFVSVPAVVALGGTWAASERRPAWLGLSTAVMGLFTLVFGFSFGSAFAPSFGLLAWATFATASAGPANEKA